MKKKISIIGTSILGLSFLYSCSSSQQQAQTQEAITNENSEEFADEEVVSEDESGEYNMGEYANEDLINPGNSAAINNAATTNEFAATENSMPLSETPIENPAAAVATDTSYAAAATASFGSGGNVMYAGQQVYGYASAVDGATPTCTLEKGDHPLLLPAGDWGQIKADQHVKIQDMSQQAVPRDRTPSAWN